MERRLAAILAADVVGYSRLIREDEAGTWTVPQVGGELQVSFALFLRYFSLAVQRAILRTLRASGIFATIIVDSSLCVG